MINRRGLLKGLFSLIAAPAVITTPGLLMPVRGIVLPSQIVAELYDGEIDLAAGRDLSYWIARFGKDVLPREFDIVFRPN